MPNWTYNEMKFESKKDFERIVKEFVRGKHFDFNTVVPMPKIIEDTEAGSVEHDLLKFAENLKQKHSPEETVELYINKINAKEAKARIFDDNQKRKLANSLKALEQYGIADWYDWACIYWGTKWNACETEISKEENTISFYTAWCPPGAFYEAFAKKYPDIRCEIYARNEDAGEDYGVYDISIQDGAINIEHHGLDEEELAELREWENEG